MAQLQLPITHGKGSCTQTHQETAAGGRHGSAMQGGVSTHPGTNLVSLYELFLTAPNVL